MKKVSGLGEIMMRLSPEGKQRFGQASELEVNYGGAEANVIESLANWEAPTSFITALPKNDLGYAVRNQLRSLGVDTEAIHWEEGRLGLYFLEHGSMSRGAKVIYDRKESVIAQLDPQKIDWGKALDDVQWLHWSGITPALSESAAELTKIAIDEAVKRGIKISVDLNYRQSLWQYGQDPINIMPDLVKHCHTIVADLYSSKVMLGLEHKMVFNNEADLREGYAVFLKDVRDHFGGCEVACSTHRESVNADSNAYRGLLYEREGLHISEVHNLTDIVDRIGGGDAFSAGVIYGVLHFEGDFKKTVNFAAAASAIKHSIKGDYNRCTVEEVESIMQDASGRVAR